MYFKFFILIFVYFFMIFGIEVDSDDHMCQKTVTKQVEVPITVRETYQERTKKWCWKKFRRCSVYKTKERNRQDVKIEERITVVEECCPGYYMDIDTKRCKSELKIETTTKKVETTQTTMRIEVTNGKVENVQTTQKLETTIREEETLQTTPRMEVPIVGTSHTVPRLETTTVNEESYITVAEAKKTNDKVETPQPGKEDNNEEVPTPQIVPGKEESNDKETPQLTPGVEETNENVATPQIVPGKEEIIDKVETPQLAPGVEETNENVETSQIVKMMDITTVEVEIPQTTPRVEITTNKLETPQTMPEMEETKTPQIDSAATEKTTELENKSAPPAMTENINLENTSVQPEPLEEKTSDDTEVFQSAPKKKKIAKVVSKVYERIPKRKEIMEWTSDITKAKSTDPILIIATVSIIGICACIVLFVIKRILVRKAKFSPNLKRSESHTLVKINTYKNF